MEFQNRRYLQTNSAILKSASEAAAEILSLDPDLSLEQHRALKHYLLKRQETPPMVWDFDSGP